MIIFKVLLIGAQQSGKTNLLNSFLMEKFSFSENYESTKGQSFAFGCQKIPSSENPETSLEVQLKFQEHSGDKQFDKQMMEYEKNPDAILIAIDLTKTIQDNEDYLKKLQESHPEIFEHSAIKILVGTKSDDPKANWETNYNSMQNFAAANKGFIAYNQPTSAKDKLSVSAFFQFVTEKISKTKPSEILNPNKPLPRDPNSMPIATESNKKIVYKNFYDHLTSLKDITSAITATEEKIEILKEEVKNPANSDKQKSISRLIAFKASLETMRNKLVDINLQLLPNSIIEIINNNEKSTPAQMKNLLTKAQQDKLAFISKFRCQDIETIANKINDIATYVNSNVGTFIKIEDLPSQIEKAVKNIGNIQLTTEQSNNVKQDNNDALGIASNKQEEAIAKYVNDNVGTFINLSIKNLPSETINQKDNIIETFEQKNQRAIKEAIKEYVNKHIGTITKIKDLPSQVKTQEIREVFEGDVKKFWIILAGVLITATCALIGGAVGLGVGSIPTAAIGTLLGIKISTTLLGACGITMATGVGIGLDIGFFHRDIGNRNAVNKSMKEIEETGCRAILLPLMQP